MPVERCEIECLLLFVGVLPILKLAVPCTLYDAIFAPYRRCCYLLQSTLSFALRLLDGYSLLFTLFNPFLQSSD